MIIKTNMAAARALNAVDKNSRSLGKSLKKVASGMKINSAGDDASGYSISERMRTQIRSLDQAAQNAQNGQSLMRVAEGAVASTVDILKTLKEKALDAANDTNTDIDRATIQKELDQAVDQINDNANVTFNGKYLFDGSADTASDVESVIIKALSSEWIKNSLSLVKDTYGLSFEENDTSVKKMDVQFEHSGGSTLAYVTNTSSSGVTNKLTLTINMDYYSALDVNDVNGSSASPGSIYLDRTLAHELTHAAMAANITNFNNLPLYIKEGAAEVTHGIDDARKTTILNLVNNSTALSTLFTSGGSTNDGEVPYAGGYMLLRYMAAQTGGDAAAVFNSFMSVLDAQGANAIDTAVSTATNDKYANLSALTTSFLTALNAASSKTDFLKDSCNIILSNEDTGAGTGADAGGSTVKTAESIVPEAGSTSFWTFPDNDSSVIDGLEVDWPAFRRGGDGLRFQVGTKASQTIRVAFSDIHAMALGLESSDGTKLSLGTREKASAAIDILDTSIEKALNQQTTIGSIQNRLDYTAANLVTASENVQHAESNIRDADMAKEMTAYTKDNVLLQAAQTMLAQASQNSSSVLNLLK